MHNQFSFSNDVDQNVETSLAHLLDLSLTSITDLLSQFVNRSEFLDRMQLAFGHNINTDALQAIWQAKDIAFPQIEIVSTASINNANGAFARETNKIYLAREFLVANQNNLSAINNVVLEEYGHYIDSQINDTDAPGDEGAIFAAVVQGKKLNENELQQLRAEDDSAVVVLDGKEVAIEQDAVSEDGRYGIDLDRSESHFHARILIRDYVTGETINTGIDLDSDYYESIDISADGRYVVFASDGNLITGNSSNDDSLYTYNRETGELKRFKPSSYDYVIGTDHGSVSADGKFAIFGENYGRDILMNTSTGDYVVFDDVDFSEISANGNYVTYENDSGIYIYSVETKESQKISQAGFSPKISGDGNYILYYDFGDLYLYNRTTQETEQVNLDENGNKITVEKGDYLFDISNNGQYITFRDEENFRKDNYYIKDLTTNTVRSMNQYAVKQTQDEIDIHFRDNRFAHLTTYDFAEIKDNGDLYVGPIKVDFNLPESELIPTVVNFRTLESRISENGAIITPLIIERTSGNKSQPISLQLNHIPDSGSANHLYPADYEFFYGKEVVIPAYQKSIEVDFISSQINEDDLYEGNESFSIKLEHGLSHANSFTANFAQIGNNDTATIVIEDNDRYSMSFNQVAEFLAKDSAYKDWSNAEGSQITLGEIYTQINGSDFYQDVFGGSATTHANLDYVVDEIFGDGFGSDEGFDAIGLMPASNSQNAPILLLRGTELTLEGVALDLLSDGDKDGVGYEQFAKYEDLITDWLDKANAEAGVAPTVIGHSLGGALAQWIAADYTGNEGQKLTSVYTFNSPAINTVEYNALDYVEGGFNLSLPDFFRPKHSPSLFDTSKVLGSVNHYITSSDPVSLAGDDYIAGTYYLYDADERNWVKNHTAPVLIDRTTDSISFSLRTGDATTEQLKNTRFVGSDDSKLASHRSFTYKGDPDFSPWILNGFTNRLTVESLRMAGGLVFEPLNVTTDIGESIGDSGANFILKVFGAENYLETNDNNLSLNFSVGSSNLSFDLAQVEAITQDYLKDFSLKDNAIDRLMLAYGDNYDLDAAQSLIDAWGNNNFSSIPEIQIVPTSEIADSNGAYRPSTNDIYLAREFVAQNQDNPEAVAAVLLEEIGHHVDTLIKDDDSLGDEGEIFSALVREERLTNEEYISLLNENDVKTMPVDETILEVISQWDDLAWQMSEEWDELAIEAVSRWTDGNWQQTLEWTDKDWQKSTLFTEEQWQETITPNQPQMSLTEVHRFYQYEKGFHLYTADANEISHIKEKSNAGEMSYDYEAEKYRVLADDKDIVTGEQIEGVEPIYRFFNTETGAHLYTMDENEKSYIQDNLDNYSFEGIKYYAFEQQPQETETIPVYRMLNTQSGAHLFSSDANEIGYIEENLSHFSMENNGNAAFHVVEL